MKTKFKCGIVAVAVMVAGFVAYQTYGSYGAQDNSLLMQNIEALAQSADAGESGDLTGEGGGITLKQCTDGDAVVITLSQSLKCADGTSMSVPISNIPIGTIYPCGTTLVDTGILSKFGYCYKPSN